MNVANTIPDPAKAATQPQAQSSPAVTIDAVAGQVANLAKLVAGCVTTDALSAVHKRIDDLARQLDGLAKGQAVIGRTVNDNLRDFTKVQPKDIHEAIQRLKAEGSTLVGFELRQAAGRKFLGWKPKPAAVATIKA